MGTIGKRRNKEEERKKEWKNERKGLTLTGLLMEGIAWWVCSLCSRSSASQAHAFKELSSTWVEGE